MTDSIEFIGLVAAVLTTAAFLPQVYKTWKTKDVESISLTMYLALFTGLLLWLTYGFLINSLPIIAANSITALSVAFLIYFKLKYRK